MRPPLLSNWWRHLRTSDCVIGSPRRAVVRPRDSCTTGVDTVTFVLPAKHRPAQAGSAYRALKTDPVSTDKKTNVMPSTSHLPHPPPGMDLARPPKIPIAPR